MNLVEPDDNLTTEERWERVKQYAPEAWEFYQNILAGEHTYWWQDKPLQLMNRTILYIGFLAQERDKAFAAGRRVGSEEAIDTITKCDRENWYKTQSVMADVIKNAIRLKMEEEK